MARFVITAAARADLLRIFDWISTHSGEDRAVAVMRRLNASIKRLASFPKIGPVARGIDGAERRHSVRPWTIFYRPLTDGGVEIMRVFDSRQDIAALTGKKS
ncbi:type II toxin-antitoxin system RelE/ParE family toxin [Caulobacter sp. AP07]|uniref:type II toxin-antitoxin system RelE/ParE family toxin n=1 Tax=Caulobacter sp. AP07 TaxID=1144304 RepID=UPI0009D9A71B|nr:type II toxin-antitoxin system RelE/ParE family toxin [Caulobacter sp. AP07]